MSSYQRKLCRIKAMRLAKLITYILLMLVFFLCNFFQAHIYVTAAIQTTIWLFAPDVIMYLLENRYHISHDLTSYK